MSIREEVPRPRYFNEQHLRVFVRLACERGYYKESFHSEHERAYRNISPDDIAYGLERDDWILCEEPNYDEKFENWEYLIRTFDIEGVELHLKIAVDLRYQRFEVISKW